MTSEEAARHVGDPVIYRRPGGSGVRGVIERIASLPVVRFEDNTVLQVAPNCLELAESATLFGDIDWST